MKEIKANPLSFLNKVVPFPQNKYYYLGMIAVAVAVAAAAEWNHFLVFELRSFAN